MAPMFRAPSAEFPNDNPLLHDGASWLCEGVRGPVTAVVAVEARPAVCMASLIGLEALETAVVVPVGEAGAAALPEMSAVDDIAVRTDALVGLDSSALAENTNTSPHEAPSDGPQVVAEDATPVDDIAPVVEAAEAVAVEAVEPVAEVAEVAGPIAEVVEPVAEVAEERSAPPTTIVPPAPTGYAAFVAALVDIAMSDGSTGAAVAICELLERGAVAEDLLEAEVGAGLLASRFVVRAAAGLDASEELATLMRGWRAVLDHNDFSGCGAATLNEWAADLLAAALGGPARASAMQYELRRRGVAAFGMVQKAA